MARYLWSSLVKLSLLLSVGPSPTLATQPSVRVNSSLIIGLETKVDNTTVHCYLGIRFGQPPKGDLRFRKPQPAPLPAEVNATHHGCSCPGIPIFSTQDEDCLFLDIYVPMKGNAESENGGLRKLPVMMWIYGGGFTFGSNDLFNGSRLAAEGGVILVVSNYRLGPFGFLSTGDNSSPGNYGLWDQLLALKWIHDYIEHFGGDASLITLFGESAGGASVSYHMSSPQSSNLFQRAILQSGCRLCPWAYNATYPPESAADQLGAVLQCNTSDGSTASLVECLRSRPFELIRNVSIMILGWTPVVDNDLVLPYSSAKKFAGPMMLGLNNYEGGFVMWILRMFHPRDLTIRMFYRKHVILHLLIAVHHSLLTSADAKAMEEAADLLDCVYRVNTSTESTVSYTELETISGDAVFLACSQQFLDGEPSMKDTYVYYFDHYPHVPGGEKGMIHSYDLSYTFGFDGGVRDPDSPFARQAIPSDDRILASHFRTLLANFAKYGNPNLESKLPNWPEWPPYSAENKWYLAISTSPKISYNLNKDKMMLWLHVIPSILMSKGPGQLGQTPWSHCYTGSANSHSLPEISLILSLVAATIPLCLLLGICL